MGSKLEYWFLLTKIAVMILGVMIEDGVGSVVPALGQLVVDLVACWWWDILLPTFSNLHIFEITESVIVLGIVILVHF